MLNNIASITIVLGIGFLNGFLTLITFMILARIALNRRVALAKGLANEDYRKRVR